MKHDWEYKKLGEVATFQRGLTYSSDDEVDFSTKCVLRSNNINLENSCLDLTELKYLREDFVIPEDRMFCDNSIFICMSNGSKQHIGKVAYIKDKINYAFGGFMGLIVPNPSVQGKFVFYNLRSSQFKHFLNSIGEGANIKNLRFTDLSKYTISIPPLSTQQSIVSELDSLSQIIADCKETLKDYDALEQSIFYDMFGDPVKNEKGWEVKKLGEVCSKISDGPFGSNLKSEHYVDKGIRVIRLQNIGIGEFINKDKVFISGNHYNTLIKYTCNSGDIVVGTLGEPNLRACKIPSTIPISIHKADCVHIVPNTCSILSDYFIALLNIPSFVKNKSNASHGQTRGRISYGQIKEFNIPVPPLSLQQEFASRITAIEQMKAETKEALQEAETLFQARMDYWFN